jgi:hypothetical protein
MRRLVLHDVVRNIHSRNEYKVVGIENGLIRFRPHREVSPQTIAHSLTWGWEDVQWKLEDNWRLVCPSGLGLPRGI